MSASSRRLRRLSRENLPALLLLAVHPFTLMGYGWLGHVLDLLLAVAGTRLLAYRIVRSDAQGALEPDTVVPSPSGFVAILDRSAPRKRTAEMNDGLYLSMGTFFATLAIAPPDPLSDLLYGFDPWVLTYPGFWMERFSPEFWRYHGEAIGMRTLFFGAAMVGAEGLSMALNAQRDPDTLTVKLDGRTLTVVQQDSRTYVTGRPRRLDRENGILHVDGLAIEAAIRQLLWLDDQLSVLGSAGDASDVPEALSDLVDPDGSPLNS